MDIDFLKQSNYSMPVLALYEMCFASAQTIMLEYHNGARPIYMVQ